MGRRLRGMDFLLLTTSGRSSGHKHTVPLLYLRDGSHLVVIASFGGKPRHPDWFQNLEKDPHVTVELEGKRFVAKARVADLEERARLWPRAVAAYVDYKTYQRRTERQIPVVILERASVP